MKEAGEKVKLDIPSNTTRGDLAIFQEIKELYERTSASVPSELSFDINALRAIAGEGKHYWQEGRKVYSSEEVGCAIYSLIDALGSDGNYLIVGGGGAPVAEIEKVDGGCRVSGLLVKNERLLNGDKIYASPEDILLALADACSKLSNQQKKED